MEEQEAWKSSRLRLPAENPSELPCSKRSCTSAAVAPMDTPVTQAPAASSACTMGTCPALAARCSGVT